LKKDFENCCYIIFYVLFVEEADRVFLIATTKRESTNLYDPSACTPARFIYSFRSKAEGKECLGPSSGYLFGEEAFFRLKKELHFGDKNFSRKKTLHISEKTTVVNNRKKSLSPS
jgi:hypothetical protein